jgi:hypothetical protein
VLMCGFINMQYKFYVDGQWRYDESQPYVTGENGVVNTLLLATDYMDVDNEAFRRMVSQLYLLFETWLTGYLLLFLLSCSDME